MSEVKVNKISPRTACGTVTLGDSGDTFTIPSGATITNNGTANGFGATGAVNWQTGSIKTAATFTAVAGEGYFVDTSSNAITANLPAGSAGAIVAFSDYARNFNNNNLTIAPDGTEKIGGIAQDLTLDVQGQALTLVYVDGTQGWINVQNAEDTETGTPPFIVATGGTTSCSGNCRIHTFTGPGTFQVTSISPTPANNALGYLIVGGGGSGGDGGTGEAGGGGGAGGFREGRTCAVTPYTVSPLALATGITATVGSFPIVVGGGGGPGLASGNPAPSPVGNNGIASSALGLTAAGGGFGAGGGASAGNAGTGGSGGGGNGRCGPGTPGNSTGQAGNTPPVSPPQGSTGGNGQPSPGNRGGGGGGATAVGGNASACANTGGAGGAGATTVISGTPTAYAGGGGGGNQSGSNPNGGTGGTGGGGLGGKNGPVPARNGSDNTGGGGGGNSCGQNFPSTGAGGNGGSGVVIIRYKKA